MACGGTLVNGRDIGAAQLIDRQIGSLGLCSKRGAGEGRNARLTNWFASCTDRTTSTHLLLLSFAMHNTPSLLPSLWRSPYENSFQTAALLGAVASRRRRLRPGILTCRRQRGRRQRAGQMQFVAAGKNALNHHKLPGGNQSYQPLCTASEATQGSWTSTLTNRDAFLLVCAAGARRCVHPCHPWHSHVVLAVLHMIEGRSRRAWASG